MTISQGNVLKVLASRRSDLDRFGVRKLALFGSVVQGKARHRSDIDFMVQFDRPTFDGYMDLKAYLEDLFGRKVDLILADAIKPALKPRIIRQAVHVAGLGSAV